MYAWTHAGLSHGLCHAVIQSVWFSASAGSVVQELERLGVTSTSFEQLMVEGVHNPVPPATASRKDLCTIMFTSGTTGLPKVSACANAQVIRWDIAAPADRTALECTSEALTESMHECVSALAHAER